MTQSLVLSIDACQGLGISPLRTKDPPECSQADLGPISAPYSLFSGFSKSLELSLCECAHRKHVLEFFIGCIWNPNFSLILRFPIGIGLRVFLKKSRGECSLFSCGSPSRFFLRRTPCCIITCVSEPRVSTYFSTRCLNITTLSSFPPHQPLPAPMHFQQVPRIHYFGVLRTQDHAPAFNCLDDCLKSPF